MHRNAVYDVCIPRAGPSGLKPDPLGRRAAPASAKTQSGPPISDFRILYSEFCILSANFQLPLVRDC